MRSSLLFSHLVVAIFLVIVHVSFSSPTSHDHPKDSISYRNTPVGLSDDPQSHALVRSGPAMSDRHLRRDMLTPSNHPSPQLLQRHAHIMEHLRRHSDESSLAKRSLAKDLVVLGFQLIWDHADVIVSSTLAYYRTTEFYKNMTIIAGGEFEFGPTTQNFMITYGCFRLFFEPTVEAGAAIGADLAAEFPGGFGAFVRGFAQMLLTLTAAVVIGTYRVLAWAATVAVWITLVVVDRADVPRLISGP